MSEAKSENNAIEALVANTAQPFERAHAMPPGVYTDSAFLDAELEHIFKAEWFCAGRASSLANPGDFTTLELAGQPVMVIRDKLGQLRAHSNVCLHRMSTLLNGRGNTRSIVCPYHAWTYNLDGSLRGAPAMNENQSFCKEQLKLPHVHCQEWLGWIMISLHPNPAPVASRLSEVEALVGDYDMQDYQEAFYETHVWDTNWKVLAENFMESYHLPVCHEATIGGTVDLAEMTCPEGEAAFNHHWILKNESFKLTLAHPDNTHLEGEDRRKTYLLSIYPALLITLTPGYFWYLSLSPDGPDHVNILYGGGLAPEFVADPEADAHFATLKSTLDLVNEEDRGCTEKVYRGLCADMSEPGPLSHLERPNFDFAKYIHSRVALT